MSVNRLGARFCGPVYTLSLFTTWNDFFDGDFLHGQIIGTILGGMDGPRGAWVVSCLEREISPSGFPFMAKTRVDGGAVF